VFSLVRGAAAGLAALASAVSITMTATVPVYAAEPPASPDGVSTSAAQPGDSCNSQVCYHWWGPSLSDSTDYAGIDHDQVWGCNKNEDELTIAIQVEPSDGSEWYTVWDNVAGRLCGELTEERSVLRFRYVAVDARTGAITGTPTEWRTPPWEQGQP
jgi:hypothetical protein